MSALQQSKFTWYLLGIFGLLVAGLVIYNYTRFAERATEEEQSQIFAEISEDSIDRISIDFEDTKTVLVKRDGTWYVEAENFKAEEGLLNTLFDTLASANIVSVASENSKKAADFSVDEEQGTLVTLTGRDEEKMKFTVGKNGPDFSSSYLKLADKDTIYLVDQDLGTVFQVPDFRELRLLDISSADVQKITLIHPDKSFTLVREEEKWLWEENRDMALDQDEAQNLVNRAANLRAASIPAQGTAAGFDAPSLIIRLEGPGLSEEIVVGKKEDESYFARNKQNTIYMLNSETFNDVAKNIGDLEQKEEKTGE